MNRNISRLKLGFKKSTSATFHHNNRSAFSFFQLIVLKSTDDLRDVARQRFESFDSFHHGTLDQRSLWSRKDLRLILHNSEKYQNQASKINSCKDVNCRRIFQRHCQVCVIDIVRIVGLFPMREVTHFFQRKRLW